MLLAVGLLFLGGCEGDFDLGLRAKRVRGRGEYEHVLQRKVYALILSIPIIHYILVYILGKRLGKRFESGFSFSLLRVVIVTVSNFTSRHQGT